MYITDVLDPAQPSALKQWDDISQNFIIANYDSQEHIDNDDGHVSNIVFCFVSAFVVFVFVSAPVTNQAHQNDKLFAILMQVVALPHAPQCIQLFRWWIEGRIHICNGDGRLVLF